MRKPALGLAALLAALALATAARASIPVDIEERSRAGLLHVCRDREPGQPDYVICVAQAGDEFSEYTGAECTAAGLPAACTVDFVAKVKIGGKLLLVNDDQAEDEIGGASLATAFVLDVSARGKKAKLVEIFQEDQIGHWNSFTEAFLVDPATAIQISDAAGVEFTFASDNLLAMNTALIEFAQTAYPTADFTGTIAVMTVVKRQKPKQNIDHAADPLASAARFKIVIQFARVRE